MIMKFYKKEELLNLSMQEFSNTNGDTLLFSFELDMIDAIMLFHPYNITLKKAKLGKNDIENIYTGLFYKEKN